MLKNNDIKVTFVSYEREFESRQLTYDYLKEATKVFDQKFFSLSDDDANQVLMQSDEVEKEKTRLSFTHPLSETDIINRLEYVRLIIDISKIPDLYTQIAGISSGIPQINTILTEFVEHRKNGYIIEEIQELEKAIPYYCEQLTNWNRSLIYSIDKINDYTGGQLVERIINSY